GMSMVCHFLPRFHPKMNPIEYFWAWVKHWFRERSNGTWQKAKAFDFDCAHLQPSAGSFDVLIDMLVFIVLEPQVQLPIASLQSGNTDHTAEFQQRT
ncbi:hypothetical protein DFH08DRAFT_723481, partial [Mycena albidolilacea]